MILQLFKGVLPSKLFLILLLGVLGWAPLFMWDVTAEQEFTLIFFTDYFVWVNNLWPYSVSMTMLVLVTLQAIYIIQINFKYILLDQRTYLPALIFGLMSIFIVSSPNAIALLTASLVWLACLDILYANSGLKISVKAMFNIGLLLAFGSMFLWQVAFLIPLFWILSFVLNTVNVRGLLAIIVGFVSIWLIYLYGLFLISGMQPFVEEIAFYKSSVKNLGDNTLLSVIPLATSSLLLLFGFLVSLFSLGNKKIITRKYYFTLSLSIVLVILVTLLLKMLPFVYLYFALVPLTFMASGYLLQTRNKWIHDIVFLIFLTGIVLFWVNKCTNLLQ